LAPDVASDRREGEDACIRAPATAMSRRGVRTVTLTATQIAVLDLERSWPVLKNRPAKRDVIRENIGLSNARYYAIVETLCDSEEAAAYDPLTVRRLRRRRDERRRARFVADPPRQRWPH
jgi:hypothetical protein